MTSYQKRVISVLAVIMAGMLAAAVTLVFIASDLATIAAPPH
jgi:hypothetical protein